MPEGMLGNNLVLRSFLNGPHRDLLEKLNDKEGEAWLFALKRFLRKENPWSEEKKLFGESAEVEVFLPAKFTPSQHFVEDQDKQVNLRIVSSDIGRFFLKEERAVSTSITLHCRKLHYATRGTPLLRQLGNAQPVPLGSVWELLRRQPQCESGLLRTNINQKYAQNIFLVEDDKGKRWFLTAWAVPSHRSWDIDLKPTSYSTNRFRKSALIFHS